ncbi:hypothetical protein [Desulfoferrobacter suflitae]|uniref:hypothetical protein n=1 Tax=Desulfoferrobacter suflitae TaxID=2865782 RepID=UPI00216491B3|nr:hypothetical protein [Desulfoferrobacter suflitae]MCK8600080.1 hypothetical protein [Desulfoferrobacter suflitae]
MRGSLGMPWARQLSFELLMCSMQWGTGADTGHAERGLCKSAQLRGGHGPRQKGGPGGAGVVLGRHSARLQALGSTQALGITEASGSAALRVECCKPLIVYVGN